MPLWNDRPDAWNEILPGVRRRILAHDPAVMMVLYEIAANTTFPRHTHAHVQSGIVLDGGGIFTVGDAAWPITRGSAYLVPGGVPHELVTHSVGPSTVLDVFVPQRDDFLSESRPADRP